MAARMPSNESASPSHHGRGEKMIVKNTFIDVFNEAESESDETGCASPHRRNNSAPPSPTRARGKMWDNQEVQSDQEEEDHDGGIPMYRGSLGAPDGCSSLQSAGTNLQKWVEMEVNAQEWDDKPANPLSPQAIRPRRKQADAWANAEASGGIDMTRPEFMSYFQGRAPALLSAGGPGDPRGVNNRFEIDLGQEQEGMPPGGMGYTLSGGLGSHSLGLQGIEAGARRPSHEAGQGFLSTMGMAQEPGYGPPDPAATLVDRMPHAAPYGRAGGYDTWGAPPPNYPACAGGNPDPYQGAVSSPGYGPCVDPAYPLYPPPPPGPPFHDHPLISAPPPGPPRFDASARQEAQPRGRKPERQDLQHRLQQHPCPSDDRYQEVPAYVHAAAQEQQQQVHQQPLLSFPPPVPQSGTNVYSPQTNVNVGGGPQTLRKGSGHEGRGSKCSDQISVSKGKSGINEGYSDPVHSKQASDLQHHRGPGKGSKSSAGSGSNGPHVSKANNAKAAAQWGQEEVQGNSNNKNGNPAGEGNSKHQQNNNEASKSGRSAPIGGGGGPKRTNYLSKYGGAATLTETGTNSAEQQITTMMLKNIPCRKGQEEVMAHVDQQGFAGRYDFFYLPRDVKFRANLGYAFINFVTQDDALRFQSEMNGYRFVGSGSSKACSVVPAHVQGLMNNLAAFKRTEVMRSNRKPFFSGVVAL